MVEQGYNYIDGSIHSMAEFFETRIEIIPPSVPSRNYKKNKKGSKKRKSVTFSDSKEEDSEDEHKGKTFCKYHDSCGHTTDECTTLKTLVSQAKQKKKIFLEKEKVHHS